MLKGGQPLITNHTIYYKGTSDKVTDELWEWTDYVVEFDAELTAEEEQQVEQDYGSVLRKLHGAYYLLNYDNFVGVTTFCGRRYKVSSRKLSADEIDNMSQCISSKMALLPYYYHNPVQSQWTESSYGEADKLHQWYFLREALLGQWEGASLTDWWHMMDRDPHHLMENTRVDTPAWSVRNVDPDTAEEIIRRPDMWVPLPTERALSYTAVAQRLQSNGRPYFPSAVRQRVNRLTYDTPENRMMKHIVQQFLEMTEWMEDRIKNRTFFNRTEVEQGNRSMNQILDGLLMSTWMKETSELTVPPRASTVLQRKVGYRQWYSFYQHWILGGRFPMPDELIRTLVDTRDIAKLYEYWCFFVVVDIVEKLLSLEPSLITTWKELDGQEQLVDGLYISFSYEGQELRVFYNKRFMGGKESYSQIYKPDISLFWKGRWHHFDAKFKIDEKAGGAKKEDIDKMHTYRDAIGQTGSVWVLYPSNETKDPLFYSAKGDSVWTEGVGTIALKPGNLSGLEKVMKALLGT